MYFHEAIAQSLVHHGVSHIFGVLGEGNLFIMDSFHGLSGGTYVGVANEATAVGAAIGFTQSSGRLGAASVTHGPGLTNCVTPLVEAVRGRTPILVIAGDTPLSDRENLQDIDQQAVARSAGAGFVRVRSTDSMNEDVEAAIRWALVKQVPVVLDVPAELQWQLAKPFRAGPQLPVSYVSTPDEGQLDVAMGILATCQRPLIIAGRGALAPAAKASLLRLANCLGAPVATTLRARDLFRGELNNLGIVGTVALDVTVQVLMRADCIVAFGAGLNRWTTADATLLANKQVIQIDHESSQVGKYYKPTAAVIGDSALVAERFIALLEELRPSRGLWSASIMAEGQAPIDIDGVGDADAPGTVGIVAALRRIDEAMPGDRTVVTDGGRYVVSAFRNVGVKDPRHFIHTLNFGAIGLGFGVAIGAAYGVPDRSVLLICGDGGLMLGGLNEFISAVRLGLDIVVVVLNDGAYGAEHIQLANRTLDPSISLFDWPDFGPIAVAMGGIGHTVRTYQELEEALAGIANRDRPMLLDIKIDVENVPY